MKDRIKSLQRSVLIQSITVWFLLLFSWWMILKWNLIESEVELSSQGPGKTVVGEGNIEVSSGGSKGELGFDQLQYTSYRGDILKLDGHEPSINLSMGRESERVEDGKVFPQGGATISLSPDRYTQNGRYDSKLYMRDDLGPPTDNNNNWLILSTNVGRQPGLVLQSHKNGELWLTFNEQGEPMIVLKAPNGKKRTITVEEREEKE